MHVLGFELLSVHHRFDTRAPQSSPASRCTLKELLDECRGDGAAGVRDSWPPIEAVRDGGWGKRWACAIVITPLTRGIGQPYDIPKVANPGRRAHKDEQPRIPFSSIPS